MQIIFNILLSCILYSIIAFSFFLIYSVSKFFHITHAAIITISAYFTYFFYMQLGLDLWLAIIASIVCSILLVILIEQFIYKPLRKRKTSSWEMLIVSLGLYVILLNLISMFWGDDKKSIRTWPVEIGNDIFGAYITEVQIITTIVSIILIITLFLFFQYSLLGKQMKAVSSNKELSNVFGISSDKIILISFIIGSFIASIAGNLIAFDMDITPTMRFHVFLYAVVAMIIGGVGNCKGIIGGALLLASTQHLSTFYLDSKWMDTVAYAILILYLVWKPLGISGIKLKKVEI